MGQVGGQLCGGPTAKKLDIFPQCDVAYWHIATIQTHALNGRYRVHSGHCLALAHIANSGIFLVQSVNAGEIMHRLAGEKMHQ